MSTIEGIDRLNSPLKKNHRLVIEGDYQSMAGEIKDFDNRYLRLKTPKCIVLSGGQYTLWSMQGHPARSFEKSSEFMKLRDFLLEFEFSSTLFPNPISWTNDKYQLSFQKAVSTSQSDSFLRVGLTSHSLPIYPSTNFSFVRVA